MKYFLLNTGEATWLKNTHFFGLLCDVTKLKSLEWLESSLCFLGASNAEQSGLPPPAPLHWALHPLHSFPHEASKHCHDHFGVHFNQVFWKGIHSCSNFSGHRDGIPKREKTRRMRRARATKHEGDPQDIGIIILYCTLLQTIYNTKLTASMVIACH